VLEKVTEEARKLGRAEQNAAAVDVSGVRGAGVGDGFKRRAATDAGTIFDIQKLNVYYDDVRAVADVDLEIAKNEITALIGPSGCGKSTLIRCLNRMNDLIPSATVTGHVNYHGQDLYAPEVDAVEVR
jgi:phosphate transport system ATP-binding protein